MVYLRVQQYDVNIDDISVDMKEIFQEVGDAIVGDVTTDYNVPESKRKGHLMYRKMLHELNELTGDELHELWLMNKVIMNS